MGWDILVNPWRELIRLFSDFPCCLRHFIVNILAVVAVFFLCAEYVLEAGFGGWLVEVAVAAVGGEIGVVIGKDGLALAGIVF